MLFARRKARLRATAKRKAESGFDALDSRLPAVEGGTLVRKAFPDHWSFLLGEIALYSLVLLVLTGSYLTFFFEASATRLPYDGSHEPLRGVLVSEAYASTLHISFEVRGGLLVRQMHHWGALVFVAAIAIHMLRIFFTGAFRKPREVNWVIGLTLFLLAIVEGFLGYSLPDDLLSGTGLRVVQSLLLSIPLVGTYLHFFLFGGEYPGEVIIERMFVLHVLFVPALLIALVVVHVVLVVYLKHTQWGGPGRSNRNVVGKPAFPQFAASSGGLTMMVFGVLTVMGGVAQINPVWKYGPYNPAQVSMASQPDWYIGFLEGSLRLMPAVETRLWGHTIAWPVLLPTVILPGLMFLCLYVYPFFEKWVTGDRNEHHLCDRPRNRPTRTGLGVAGITFYVVLFLAGGNDVLAMTFDISVNALTWSFRVAFFLGPVLTFMLTKRYCLALQDRDATRIEEGDESGEIRQNVQGGYEDVGHTALPPRQRYTLMVQDKPRALRLPAAPDGRLPSRRERLRVALSRWYYRDSAGKR